MLGPVEVLMTLEKTRNGRPTNPGDRAHAIWMGEQALKLVAKLEEHLNLCMWGGEYGRRLSKELRKELAAFNAAFATPPEVSP